MRIETIPVSPELKLALHGPNFDWQRYYPVIWGLVRTHLAKLEPDHLLTAQAVVERFALIDPTARKRVHNALKAGRDHGLYDCWSAGPTRVYYGKRAQTSVWHRPRPGRQPPPPKRAPLTLTGTGRDALAVVCAYVEADPAAPAIAIEAASKLRALLAGEPSSPTPSLSSPTPAALRSPDNGS